MSKDAYAEIQIQERLLSNALNEFNAAFATYQSAPDNNEFMNQLKDKTKQLSDQIVSYNNTITRFIEAANKDSIPNNNVYASLISRQKANAELRNELDLKLKEIYGGDGTIQGDFKYKYDNTAYASIMWSVLATSLIYYVFVKL